MQQVAILGSGSYADLFPATMYKTSVFPPNRPIHQLKEKELVVFTGGADVDPKVYGHHRLEDSNVGDEDREQNEFDTFQQCAGLGIPMIGICRGAQFLNVMNGGWLIQHCDNHVKNHAIRTKNALHDKIQVSSTHHQMMVPGHSAVLNAWAEQLSAEYKYDTKTVDKPRFAVDQQGLIKEPEVLYYPGSQSLCIQFHPEYMGQGTPARRYFTFLMFKYIWETQDDNSRS